MAALRLQPRAEIISGCSTIRKVVTGVAQKRWSYSFDGPITINWRVSMSTNVRRWDMQSSTQQILQYYTQSRMHRSLIAVTERERETGRTRLFRSLPFDDETRPAHWEWQIRWAGLSCRLQRSDCSQSTQRYPRINGHEQGAVEWWTRSCRVLIMLYSSRCHIQSLNIVNSPTWTCH
jgi:hypothetical protein